MDIGSLYIDHYLKQMCLLNTRSSCESKLLSEDCVVIVQTDHGVAPESVHAAHSASCSQ